MRLRVRFVFRTELTLIKRGLAWLDCLRPRDPLGERGAMGKSSRALSSSPPEPRGRKHALTIISPPSGVNFNALEIKLRSWGITSRKGGMIRKEVRGEHRMVKWRSANVGRAPTTWEILNLSKRIKSVSSIPTDPGTWSSAANSTRIVMSLARAWEWKMPQQELTKVITLMSPLWISMMPAWIFSNVRRSLRMSTCEGVDAGVGSEGSGDGEGEDNGDKMQI